MARIVVAASGQSTAPARPFDSRHLLLLTEDGAKLAVHRYQAQPGDPDYLPPGDPLAP